MLSKTKKSACSKKINLEDLKTIQQLLDSGISFQQSLLFFSKKYKQLEEQLEAGISLQDALQNKKDSISKHLCFFLLHLSIKDAITYTISIQLDKQQVKKLCIKKFTYPFIVLITAMMVLSLCYLHILPMLTSMFSMDTQNVLSIRLIAFLYHITTLIRFVFVFMLIVIVIMNVNQKVQSRFIDKYVHLIPFIKQYCSFVLLTYMNILHSNGQSTYEVLTSMKELKVSWIQHFCEEIQQKLQYGKDYLVCLKESKYLTEDAYQALKMRAISEKMNQPLLLYIKQQQFIWIHTIKKTAAIFLICLYIFIAVFVINLFQLMLLPMNILQDF